MQLQRMSSHECMLYAAAMTTATDAKELAAKIPANDKEILWPDMPGPLKMRGYHEQEIMDALDDEWAISMYSARFLGTYFRRFITNRIGILCSPAHAVACDGHKVYDAASSGGIREYDQKENWYLFFEYKRSITATSLFIPPAGIKNDLVRYAGSAMGLNTKYTKALKLPEQIESLTQLACHTHKAAQMIHRYPMMVRPGSKNAKYVDMMTHEDSEIRWQKYLKKYDMILLAKEGFGVCKDGIIHGPDVDWVFGFVIKSINVLQNTLDKRLE